MNLLHLFDFSLVGRRDQPALEFVASDGRREDRTFGEIENASNRFAHALSTGGLVAGDRLCICLPNGAEVIELFLACVKLGVIYVPVNILYREREVGHIVSDAQPKAVVTATELPELVRAAAESDAQRMPAARLDGDSPAAIVYTSGTTGASKGAVLTHNNFAANAINLVTCWQISAADRLMLPLPLFHVHGLGNGLHSWLIAAAACGCWSGSSTRRPRNRCLTSGQRFFSACPLFMSACSKRQPGLLARSAVRCGYSCPDRRRWQPRC